MAEKTGWVILEKKDDDTGGCTTYGMQTPTGTLVRTYETYQDPDGYWHATESLVFIPGVLLKQQDDKTWQFHFL